MKQFAFGSLQQFNNLYNKIINGNVALKFEVLLPNNQHAKLVFMPLEGRFIQCFVTNINIDYNSNNDFMKSVLNGKKYVFSDSQEMYNVFSSLKEEFKDSFTSGIITSEPIVVNSASLSKEVRESLIGQDGQIDKLSKGICNHLRKKHPSKPYVAMLLGPTGVGKTATIKKIVEILQKKFSKDQFPLIQINCNEFQQSFQLSELIGSPAGYVGYADKCILEPIKKTHSPIILLDEFEKAHRDVSMAVMNWIDTGRITLARIDEYSDNAEYDCSRGIIVMTSNIFLDAKENISMRFCLRENEVEREDVVSSIDEKCRKAMVKYGFKPEVAARISNYYEYKSLNAEDMKKIAIIVFKNKLKEYGVIVNNIDDELKLNIESLYNPSDFGVRVLENTIDNILCGHVFLNTDTECVVNVRGTIDNLEFEKL